MWKLKVGKWKGIALGFTLVAAMLCLGTEVSAAKLRKPEGTEEAVDRDHLHATNYKPEALTDWQEISEALESLAPEDVTNPDKKARTLVLQVQNADKIPEGIKDSLVPADDSEYTKILQCSLGNGVAIVLNGATDNSGFRGIDNTEISFGSVKRGRWSVATTVSFKSHENLGTVAGLQVNLPKCRAGAKVSVYAETVTIDGEGNVTVGENVCIGTTRADENGNVEIPIQATANYMFVYREAKK